MRRLHLISLALATVMGACGDDDGVSPEAAIIGTWEFVEVQNASPGVTVEETITTFAATTVTIVFANGDCTETATYTLIAGTLKLTVTSVNGLDCFDGVGDVVDFQVTVSGDTLRMSFADSGTAFTIVFARVT